MAARAPELDRLSHYRSKRDFNQTTEPAGKKARGRRKAMSFVVQKHAASRLHYDFRLELDGVLVSWAVPKGPSFDPSVKRMAIHVEDHPLSYGAFEGTIPPGQYGAGSVIVWDTGTWQPEGDPRVGLAQGKLAFTLAGHKLQGGWELIRTANRDSRQAQWLLFKKRDHFARSTAQYDVLAAEPASVLSAAPCGPIVGAVRSPLPARLSPQLATLASTLPNTGRWAVEIKFDGYRLMARVDQGTVALFTRGGHDWTAKLQGLARSLERLCARKRSTSGWLDGELVVLGTNGVPDFNALQKAFDGAAGEAAMIYFLFDVPFLDGYDLRGAALSERRSLLKQLLDRNDDDRLRFSANFETAPESALASACRMKLEGLIAKRLDAHYVSRRTDTWLKLKCKQRQEFIVCGYTDRSDGSPQIGSLALGVHDDDGRLVAAGHVGTGWSAQEAHALKRRLAPIEVATPPFEPAPHTAAKRYRRSITGAERWVDPKLVAEIEFAEWTPDGAIRHASYVGLRSDKPAKAITRDSSVDMAGSASAAQGGRHGSRSGGSPATANRAVKVTSGDRVIDRASGLTKLDLVRYYESVADWMLPHLKGRPVALLRAPEGVDGPLFFQKHDAKSSIPGLRSLDPALSPEHDALLEAGSLKALRGAAQMNVIEFHTWNSTVRRLDRPDRMIFDLDPGEGVSWQQIVEGCTLVRGFVEELGLRSWLKTSGGKGLHVVVPIARRMDYDTVKRLSRGIVQHLAKTVPSRFVAKSGPANRKGRLFVDYLRNGEGATTVAAFSARARPGLGVSMPLPWDALETLERADQFTVANTRDHLSFMKEDPWADYWKNRQTVTVAMKAMGVTAGS